MRITMIGTGYVGLVSGACFAKFGIEVTCVDKDKSRIDSLLANRVPIYEPGLDDYVQRNVAAGRLPGGNNQVLEGGLAAAIKEAREKPGTVRGIIEIVLNVYSWDEDVRMTCYDPSGRQLWKKKSSVNAGGSEEELARKLFERTLQKVEKMPPCGSGK